MTIDDVLDHDVDALVDRTRNRAIPRGAISLQRAWLFFALQVVVGIYTANATLRPTTQVICVSTTWLTYHVDTIDCISPCTRGRCTYCIPHSRCALKPRGKYREVLNVSPPSSVGCTSRRYLWCVTPPDIAWHLLILFNTGFNVQSRNF